jgi:hypothetical protein
MQVLNEFNYKFKHQMICSIAQIEKKLDQREQFKT